MTEQEIKLLKSIADAINKLREEIHADRIDRAAQQKQPSPQPPLPVAITTELPLPVAATEYYRANKNNKWGERLKKTLEIGGILVALWIGLLNLKVLRQIEAQTPAVVKSADAAKSAAEVAQNTLHETIKQFQIQNRAYLILLNSNETNGGYGLVKVSLRNYGHVDARHVTLTLTLDRLATTAPVIREPIPVRLPDADTIAPSDTTSHTWLIFTPNFGSQFLTDTRTGKQTLRLMGDAKYDSGFGGTRETIPVCYFFQGISNTWQICDGETTTYLQRSEK